MKNKIDSIKKAGAITAGALGTMACATVAGKLLYDAGSEVYNFASNAYQTANASGLSLTDTLKTSYELFANNFTQNIKPEWFEDPVADMDKIMYEKLKNAPLVMQGALGTVSGLGAFLLGNKTKKQINK
ncbi:MAG: hypothetical protein ABFQ65_02860 [Nanoarchaeota archaeon]